MAFSAPGEDGSAEAVARLREMKLRTVLLTGDAAVIAQKVGRCPLRFYQRSRPRMVCACRLLTISSWPLVSVSSHRWLLIALILRT